MCWRAPKWLLRTTRHSPMCSGPSHCPPARAATGRRFLRRVKPRRVRVPWRLRLKWPLSSGLSGALAEPIRALASNEEIERMFAHFEQALLALDFFDPAQPKRLLPRLRRFFARTQLEHEEVSLMRGIAKAILQDRRIARVGIANQ